MTVLRRVGSYRSTTSSSSRTRHHPHDDSIVVNGGNGDDDGTGGGKRTRWWWWGRVHPWVASASSTSSSSCQDESAGGGNSLSLFSSSASSTGATYCGATRQQQQPARPHPLMMMTMMMNHKHHHHVNNNANRQSSWWSLFRRLSYGVWVVGLLVFSAVSLYVSTSAVATGHGGGGTATTTMMIMGTPGGGGAAASLLLLTGAAAYWDLTSSSTSTSRGLASRSSSDNAGASRNGPAIRRGINNKQQQQYTPMGNPSSVSGHANTEVSLSSPSSSASSASVPSSRPAIAWLVSFPNSGTTYTIANAELVTGQTTATNYAVECIGDVLQPLYPDLSSSRTYEDAPFLMSPHLPLPAKYILTKTHCTGYSDDRPWKFDLHDAISFEEFCRFGFVPPPAEGLILKEEEDEQCSNSNKNRPPRRSRVRRDPKYYTSIDNVQKIVHLIRSPFDNLVARMHLGVSERKKQPVHLRDERFLSVMDDTPEGLRNWCEYVDQRFHNLASLNSTNPDESAVSRAVSDRDVTLSRAMLSRMRRVRCHSEIFRYTQFHNLVTQMSHDETLLRLVSPPHVMYYEDYSSDLVTSTARLAEFLEQPMHRPPARFYPGKTYGHLWTQEEQNEVAALIHDLATPHTWRLLKRYFPWWTEDNSTTTTTGASSSAKEVAALADYRESLASSDASTPMVWLMAYPRAGSMFMLHNLVTASNFHVLAATHTRHEARMAVVSAAGQPDRLTPQWKKLWPDHPEQSPFLFRTDASGAAAAAASAAAAALSKNRWVPSMVSGRHPSPVVVTKNQCYRWTCLTCSIPEEAATFERSCRTVPPTKPNRAAVPLDLARVRQMIVLVRNPFDVIRSRANNGLMQLVNEETGSNITITLPTNISVILTEERVSDIRDRREGLELWCHEADSQFQKLYPARQKQPPKIHGHHQSTWWDRALKAYGNMKRAVTCSTRWMVSKSEKYTRLKQVKAIPDIQYTEFPVDWARLDEFRSLLCYSELFRIVQWYNHVLEFSRPRRTLPRQILRFEDYSHSESVVQSKFDELAESLLGHPLDHKIRERHFNETRPRHVMLFTAEEAGMAEALVRRFGSPQVWQLFQSYFASMDTGVSIES